MGEWERRGRAASLLRCFARLRRRLSDGTALWQNGVVAEREEGAMGEMLAGWLVMQCPVLSSAGGILRPAGPSSLRAVGSTSEVLCRPEPATFTVV